MAVPPIHAGKGVNFSQCIGLIANFYCQLLLIGPPLLCALNITVLESTDKNAVERAITSMREIMAAR